LADVRTAVNPSSGVPAVGGHYSPAVRFGNLLFCAGQIPLDPASGDIVGQTPAEQTRQCLRNLQAVCAAADATLEDALRLTVYMTDIGFAAQVNEAYASFFPKDPPARAAVAVSALPRQALVEIDAIVGLGLRG
jgi:2-iminobutanoate/2-iminopropanoate deaminase